jgi:hypothetical protein
MQPRSLLVGFLAGGWLATLVAVSGFSLFPAARAAAPPPDPATPVTPGRTINPSAAGPQARGAHGEGLSTTGFNNRAIAITGSTTSGASVVYYFDTELQRLLVYEYDSGSRGGIRLMSARHIDYDLRLEGYRDVSASSRDDLKAAYDKQFGPKAGDPNDLPVKKVDMSGGK